MTVTHRCVPHAVSVATGPKTRVGTPLYVAEGVVPDDGGDAGTLLVGLIGVEAVELGRILCAVASRATVIANKTRWIITRQWGMLSNIIGSRQTMMGR